MIERGHSWAPWFRERVKAKRELALAQEWERIWQEMQRRMVMRVSDMLTPDPFADHDQWPIRQ